MGPTPARAILFDAEGVVVDTEPVWDDVQEAFLAARGIGYEREVVKPHLTGRSLLDGTRVLKERYALDGEVAALAQERADLMRARLAGSVRFLPGFETFFAAARQRFRVCVATSMPADLFALADNALGLGRLFGGNVVTVDRVGGVGKPAPDLFAFAAGVVDTPAPSCVVIEDSPLGIDAAHAAAMACVGLASTYQPDVLRGADIVVGSFDELDVGTLDALLDRRPA